MLEAVALYQLTSIATGVVFVATVVPRGNGQHRIAWKADGVDCFHHDVPPPIENAARNAFLSGVYAAVFQGAERV